MTKQERLAFVNERLGKEHVVIRTKTPQSMKQLLEQPFIKEDLVVINQLSDPPYLECYLSSESLEALHSFLLDKQSFTSEEISIAVKTNGLSNLYPL
ncbi:hypothetical protein [Vagococcus zengguangii]|uniref:Uncharacterized protein n=1 Tax=Vagococcus zengguangii TaxID=2571750 RepID=A0A4D7CT93_9ENTE|nr:hypothetical protein [Vagococcus zengguangii]QCI85651.1 hypothetical protein FA707_01110 [Vagococcus zengguangii]TLG81591.1 hypothetical protein FE258_00090 [Vagococcus zengguangii]